MSLTYGGEGYDKEPQTVNELLQQAEDETNYILRSKKVKNVGKQALQNQAENLKSLKSTVNSLKQKVKQDYDYLSKEDQETKLFGLVRDATNTYLQSLDEFVPEPSYQNAELDYLQQTVSTVLAMSISNANLKQELKRLREAVYEQGESNLERTFARNLEDIQEKTAELERLENDLRAKEEEFEKAKREYSEQEQKLETEVRLKQSENERLQEQLRANSMDSEAIILGLQQENKQLDDFNTQWQKAHSDWTAKIAALEQSKVLREINLKQMADNIQELKKDVERKNKQIIALTNANNDMAPLIPSSILRSRPVSPELPDDVPIAPPLALSMELKEDKGPSDVAPRNSKGPEIKSDNTELLEAIAKRNSPYKSSEALDKIIKQNKEENQQDGKEKTIYDLARERILLRGNQGTDPSEPDEWNEDDYKTGGAANPSKFAKLIKYIRKSTETKVPSIAIKCKKLESLIKQTANKSSPKLKMQLNHVYDDLKLELILLEIATSQHPYELIRSLFKQGKINSSQYSKFEQVLNTKLNKIKGGAPESTQSAFISIIISILVILAIIIIFLAIKNFMQPKPKTHPSEAMIFKSAY